LDTKVLPYETKVWNVATEQNFASELKMALFARSISMQKMFKTKQQSFGILYAEMGQLQ